MMDDPDTRPPGQRKIYNLYALFGVSMVMSVIPHMSAAVLSIIFFLWLLIAAYTARGKAGDHDLLENHATFIIRTLWITALFSLFTMGAAAVYIFYNLDYTTFQPCVDQISSLGIAEIESMGTMEIYSRVEPCVDDFISFNFNTLLVAGAIAGIPLLAYAGYRFAKGLARAVKGYRLADPKAWF